MLRLRKTFVLLLTLLLLSVTVLACSSSNNANSGGNDSTGGTSGGGDKRPIKVGFPAPLSGPSAGTGSDMEKGITLAIEEINAAGGILGHPVELVKGDVEGQEPSMVTTVVRRLISRDKVDIMVTGLVNPSLVELDIMQQNKMPYIFYGYAQAQERMIEENPDKDLNYIYNAIPSYKRYQTEFPNLVQKWIDEGLFEPNNKKIAVIKSQNDYSLYTGEGMQKTFESMGWEVVVDETIPYERFTEFSPILNQIREHEPSVIMYTDHTAANAATFLTSFLQNPTQSIVFLQATPSYPEFQEIMAGRQDGVIWNYAASMLGEKKAEFEAKYEKRWNEKPNPYGGFVYDAMMIAADAMTKAGDPFDKEKINEVLSDPNYSYEGYIGTYRFDPKTHLAISGSDGIPFATYQVWNEEHIVISPDEYAEGEFRLPPWYNQ